MVQKLVGVVTKLSHQIKDTWNPWWQRHQASLPAYNEGGVTKFVRPSTANCEKWWHDATLAWLAEQKEGKPSTFGLLSIEGLVGLSRPVYIDLPKNDVPVT